MHSTLGHLVIFHQISWKMVENHYSHVPLTKKVGTFWISNISYSTIHPKSLFFRDSDGLSWEAKFRQLSKKRDQIGHYGISLTNTFHWRQVFHMLKVPVFTVSPFLLNWRNFASQLIPSESLKNRLLIDTKVTLFLWKNHSKITKWKSMKKMTPSVFCHMTSIWQLDQERAGALIALIQGDIDGNRLGNMDFLNPWMMCSRLMYKSAWRKISTLSPLPHGLFQGAWSWFWIIVPYR